MLFVPSVFAMLLVAGARLKHLAIVVLAATLAAPMAYPFLKPYQQQRILGLIAQVRGDQHARDDMNYQAYTAQMLIGAGGTTGIPDAKSRAVIRFARLPERHNDMIFAVVVNRFGLLGGLAVAGLYMLWLAGALLSAALCKDPFGRLTIVGLSAFIAAQAAINIGMNVGVLPIVGLTLPFVSYGGSSMLVVWIMTGLTLSIALRPPPRMARPSFEFRD
jgi:rod shape determining protein RodA